MERVELPLDYWELYGRNLVLLSKFGRGVKFVGEEHHRNGEWGGEWGRM